MLHVHRSERADALVVPLAAVLAEAPADPFAVDVVAVPTRGVERWLAQQLSHHLGTGPDGESGIAANIRFDSPGRLLDEAVAGVLGTAPAGASGRRARTDDDPWSRDRLTWSLLEVVDACANEPWCTALGRYLGAALADDDVRRGRRMQVATHLAGLFTTYGTQRPDMLDAWARGVDDDGTGRPLPEDLRWQMVLWQRVRDHVGETSPAEHLAAVVERLRADPGAVDLPQRLSVFGATRLAEHRLRVLAALAEHREVHLWLPHPSPALWDAVGAAPPIPAPLFERELVDVPTGTVPAAMSTSSNSNKGAGGGAGGAGAPAALRRADVHVPARHPLLASMARDVVELQLRLATTASPGTSATTVPPGTSAMTAPPATAVTDTHHPAPTPSSSLLGALQHRLRTDDDGPATHLLDPADHSVRVHACHGRARQVEVLREVVTGLLADDPTLEPRDVVVMCPDVEAFAPLVAATFGATDDDLRDGAHPGRTLRVRVADRSLRQTNPVLALLADLLELADGRVTASDVVDLASSEPVRRRLGFDDEAVDRIRAWAVEAGARWGEDLERRRRFGLGHVAQGTWQTALDRILLGVAMAEEDHRWVGSALPLDDVDSTEIELAGRLAELVDRLQAVLGRLEGAHPADHWLDVLDHAIDLLGGTSARDSWQEVEARQVLDEARRAASRQGPGTLLRLADVRSLLAHRLAGRPTRAGFRTGALTVCSMEPMRAVPHRVVVLLGLDDGAFPRGVRADGDDLLLRDPLVGERDRRSEDRQVFLDAVSAATDHLVVLHSGADERTGAGRPPAVPVSELLDALDAAATAPDGAPVREHVVVRHPLQTVDERNFADGALARPGPFSFDAVSLRAAVAARGERTGRRPFLDAPLPPVADDDAPGAPGGAGSAATVDLDELVRVLENPVRAFVRSRLGVSLPGETADVDDALPLALEGLASWQVGDRLLQAALAGVELERAIAAEQRRGEVPPRYLGGAVLDDLATRVRPIAEVAAERSHGPAGTVDVTARVRVGSEDRLVTGTVLGVHDGVLVRAVYSKLAAKHRLRAWVQLLALVVDAAADGTGASGAPPSFSAVTVGRSPARAPRAALAELTAPHPDDAARWLAALVELRDAALREPLPLPVAASCAYARSRAAGDTVEQALESAAREFTGAYDHLDDHLQLAWGDRSGAPGTVTFDAVLAPEPPSAEQVWWPEERTRFGVLARRLWDPMLDHERTETL